MAVINLTWTEIDELVGQLAHRLPPDSCCWGVPRGGSVVAALLRSNHGISITADWTEATIAVDDIIDSGHTAQQVWKRQGLKVEALIVKESTDWIVFPWEGTELGEDAEHTVTRFLEQIGEDPKRPELERMPRRVVNLWERLFSGYQYSIDDLPDLIGSGGTGSNGSHPIGDVVVPPGIPFVSSCEKHLIPFYGRVRVGYVASNSHGDPENIPKLVDILSRRLQVRERLADQICRALEERTKGAAVLLEANYLCPMVRGRTDSSETSEITAFGGVFKDSEELQDRFLQFVKQEVK